MPRISRNATRRRFKRWMAARGLAIWLAPLGQKKSSQMDENERERVLFVAWGAAWRRIERTDCAPLGWAPQAHYDSTVERQIKKIGWRFSALQGRCCSLPVLLCVAKKPISARGVVAGNANGTWWDFSAPGLGDGGWKTQNMILHHRTNTISVLSKIAKYKPLR